MEQWCGYLEDRYSEPDVPRFISPLTRASMAIMDSECPNKSAFHPSKLFQYITAACLALGLVLLVYGWMHVSSEPVVLERYSITYVFLLAGIAGVVVFLAWLLWRPTKRIVHLAYNIFTLIAATMIAVGCVEAGLRVLNPWGMEFFHTLPYHMQGMVDHPQLGYVHPKSITYKLGAKTVALNAHGLRDEEIPYAKPAGEKRILALGDSVTFGWGVDQGKGFCDHMESLLNSSKDDITWQVINAGVNGYNSIQEVTYLRIEGMRYNPDVVILTYVRNDVDAIFDPNPVTWRRYPSWPSSLPEMLDRLRSLSFLYQVTSLFARLQEVNSIEKGQPKASRRLSPALLYMDNPPYILRFDLESCEGAECLVWQRKFLASSVSLMRCSVLS